MWNPRKRTTTCWNHESRIVLNRRHVIRALLQMEASRQGQWKKFYLTGYELTGIWIPTDAVMYVDSTRIENPRIKILFWWLEKFNFIANGNISYSIWFLLGEVTNNIGPENVTRNELRRYIPLPSRGCDIFWKAEQTGWIRITLHGINLEAYHD